MLAYFVEEGNENIQKWLWLLRQGMVYKTAFAPKLPVSGWTLVSFQSPNSLLLFLDILPPQQSPHLD